MTSSSVGSDKRLSDARNLIDEKTSSDWIIWWDADFIAFGEKDGHHRSFKRLIELIQKSDVYNQILFGGPNLGPVNGYTLKNKPYQGSSGDTQITRKGFMRFEVGEYIDTRIYNEEPKTLYINSTNQTSYFLHLDKIKPISRLIIRDLLYRFEVEHPLMPSTPSNFKNWLKKNRPNFSIEGAKAWTLKAMQLDLIKFDYGKYGNLPQILEEFEPLQWYELKDNKIEYNANSLFDSPYKIYFEE